MKEKKGRKAKGYDGWSHDAERRLCAPKKIDATQQNEKNVTARPLNLYCAQRLFVESSGIGHPVLSS